MGWCNILFSFYIITISPTFHNKTIKEEPYRPILLSPSSFLYSLTEDFPQVSKESVAIKRNFEPDRWIGWDKFWHLSASFVTLGAGYHLCANRLEFKENIAQGISIGGTFALGIGKELLDRYGFRRRFSWKDIAFNLLGITLGYFVFVY